MTPSVTFTTTSPPENVPPTPMFSNVTISPLAEAVEFVLGYTLPNDPFF
jgi:hypothetical protein